MKWNRFLDRGGILSSQSLDAMQSGLAKTEICPGCHYGLGLIVQEKYGKRALWHGGGLPGYVSLLARFPGENISFVVLSNTMDRTNLSQLMNALQDQVFLGKATVPDAVPEVDLPVETLRTYNGIYRNDELKLDIVITEEGGSLYAEITNQGRVRLKAIAETVFDLAGVAEISFVKNSEGTFDLVLIQGRPYEFKRVPAVLTASLQSKMKREAITHSTKWPGILSHDILSGLQIR